MDLVEISLEMAEILLDLKNLIGKKCSVSQLVLVSSSFG